MLFSECYDKMDDALKAPAKDHLRALFHVDAAVNRSSWLCELTREVVSQPTLKNTAPICLEGELTDEPTGLDLATHNVWNFFRWKWQGKPVSHVFVELGFGCVGVGCH